MDESEPLQARTTESRLRHRSKLSIGGRGDSYVPRRGSIKRLLAKANERQELDMLARHEGSKIEPRDTEDDDDDDEDSACSSGEEQEVVQRAGQKRSALGEKDLSMALRVALSGQPGFFDAKRTDQMKQLLKDAGDGFVLRGWRRKFDPEGALHISFAKFCRVCFEMGFVKRSDDLYALPRDFTNITLTHVNPELGSLLESFRKWIHMKFHGHAIFFDAFDHHNRNAVSPEEFVRACEGEGFSASEQELCELYSCCDWKGRGEATKDDVVYLEHDAALKERESIQIKRRRQYELDKIRADSYTEELAKGLAPCQRLAIRPWAARKYEEMPEIQRHVHSLQEKNRVKKGLEARVAFLRFVRRLHGNEVTAWRRCMDVEGKFLVSEAKFRQLCRHLDFAGSVNMLWFSFDPDHDGTLSLEQLSPQAAILLARFRSWVHNYFGSCIKLWDSPAGVARRKKPHLHNEGEFVISKHMSWSCFAQLLKFFKCPMIQGQNGKAAQHFICKSLDVGGGQFITRCDFEWLDRWTPSEWLTAEPDEGAWQDLSAALVDKYGHILKAWFELDADNSNRLSWSEFCDGCENIEFQGTMGAAWRWLDKDLVGWISLAAVDEESASILLSFKDWAEARFGSLQSAFKTISGGSASSNTLTYHEFRIACRTFQWDGDARLLFDCLTKNGENVSLKDVAFLSHWANCSSDNARLLKATTDALWQEMLEAKAPARKMPTLAVCHGLAAVGSRPASVEQSISSLDALDAGYHGQSISSLPESMYSLPEEHCAPRAAFLGAPYARPVTREAAVSPLITIPAQWLQAAAAPRKMVKSSSLPAPVQKSDGSIASMGIRKTNSGKSLKGSGPARKRDPWVARTGPGDMMEEEVASFP